MKRRIFNILATMSLVLCLATAGLWAYGPWWMDTAWLRHAALTTMFIEVNGRLGVHVGLTPNGLWVYRGNEDTPQAPAVARDGVFAGFEYEHGAIPPDGVNPALCFERLVTPYWFLCALGATLPALWLWWHRRERSARRDDGMPHCPKCDYNLTGNVSGICPECGTPIPAAAAHRRGGESPAQRTG